MIRAIILALLPTLLHAGIYDAAPPAAPPYYQVRYETSPDPTGLQLPVTYTLWVPADVETLRGVVVHQHGCGTGSAKSGMSGAYDLHWQALARAHGCALLSPVYEVDEEMACSLWCEPTNGSDAAFQRALEELGSMSGHPELKAVPWALWGHSGGAFWCSIMTALHPERVAATWMRSGVLPVEPRADRNEQKLYEIPEAMLAVPLMVNIGTGEGVSVTEGRFSSLWPRTRSFVKKVRARNGLAAVAVDPLTGHECGNQRYLAIPWFDTCLKARLPESNTSPLKAIPHDSGVLVPFLEGEPVSPTNLEGDPSTMGWLPDQKTAQAWSAYVADTDVPDSSPPPAPHSLELTDGKLTWQAGADLQSGLSGFIIKRNGKTIAELPEKNRNPFGRPVFQGLLYSDTPKLPLQKFEFTDPSPADTADAYQVISKNTAGLPSTQ